MYVFIVSRLLQYVLKTSQNCNGEASCLCTNSFQKAYKSCLECVENLNGTPTDADKEQLQSDLDGWLILPTSELSFLPCCDCELTPLLQNFNHSARRTASRSMVQLPGVLVALSGPRLLPVRPEVLLLSLVSEFIFRFCSLGRE